MFHCFFFYHKPMLLSAPPPASGFFGSGCLLRTLANFDPRREKVSDNSEDHILVLAAQHQP